MNYILVGLISALVSFGASLAMLKLSKRFRIYPGIRERDVHTTPTPRLGGVAIVLGVGAAFALASALPAFDRVFVDPVPVLGMCVAISLMAIVGILDDLYDLDWLIKLGAQILAAGVMAWSGIQIVSLPTRCVNNFLCLFSIHVSLYFFIMNSFPSRFFILIT